MEAAWEKWQKDNTITVVDTTRDALYGFDQQEQDKLMSDKAWQDDPKYFKNVRISAVALLKMTMHARSGGSLEVMGLMLGVVHGDTFVVTDSFRLPVEGTETRVNAQEDANEYMINYITKLQESGRKEVVVGWYHSHPGYGCWLSGIDVQTQFLQQHNDPFLAIVIDPERTMSAEKVEIGAFRTYPKDYNPPQNKTSDGWQVIPLEKAKDFGAHVDRYYSLEVSYYKSTLDTHLLSSLWNKYWVSTLSSNPLLSNYDYTTKQIKDLSSRITESYHNIGDTRREALNSKSNEFDVKLDKLVKTCSQIQTQQETGIISSSIKTKLFNVE